ncbi:MAG TPA: GNAT family N-acetyltransferase, partial [Nevskiaceae bacterium]|nr:GNAT family N-acetyltransferase [Nevskiaceae bacterium]
MSAALPETERLRLRRFRDEDLDWLVRLNADPAVMRFLGGPMAAEDTAQMLRERILAYYDAHPGLGVWVTESRADGTCLGFHLLNHIRGSEEIQVGYRLFPEAWGRGVAGEMARALLAYGFHTLSLDQICGITHPEHTVSQRVLQKIGLEDRDSRHYALYGEVRYFANERESWQNPRR